MRDPRDYYRCRVFACNADEKALYLIGKVGDGGEVEQTPSGVDGSTSPEVTDSPSFKTRGLRRLEWGTGIAGLIAQSGEFVTTPNTSMHPSYVAAIDRGEAGEASEQRGGVSGSAPPSPSPHSSPAPYRGAGEVAVAAGRAPAATVAAESSSSAAPGSGLLGVAVRGADGRVCGVIIVTDKLLGAFNGADEALLKHVSELVAKELLRNSTISTIRRAQQTSDNLVLASEMLHVQQTPQQDANALMERLHREAVWRCQQLTGAEMCALYELNAEDNTLTLAEYTLDGEGEGEASARLVGESPAETPNRLRRSHLSPPRVFDQKRGLVGAASTSGAQRIIDDPSKEDQFDAEVDNPLGLTGIRSMAIAPCFDRAQAGAKVQAEGGSSSVLVLFNKRSDGATFGGPRSDIFSESDSRMLTIYSRLVGSVHSYAVTMRELQGKLHASSSVVDVAMTLTANLQGQNLYHNVTSLARHLVPSEWGTLYIADENSSSSSAFHASLVQVRDDGQPGVFLRVGEGVAGSAAQAMASVVMRSPKTDPRFIPTHYGESAARVREVLAFPLIDSQGHLKGVLELVNRLNAPSFRKSDEEELTPFCKLAGITLHNSRMLQVAQRTGTQNPQNLRRRASMIGVKRGHAGPPGLASPSAAPSSAAADGGDDGEAVEIGLVSTRKLRASVF